MPKQKHNPTIIPSIEENPQSYPSVNLHDLRHDKDGREHLDPTPMQPPLGFNKQPSLTEQIRNMVRAHSKEIQDNDPETIEEADDFEMDEDMDPHSRWENDFEPSIGELKARYEERLKAEKEAAQPPPTPTSTPPFPGATPPVPPEPTPRSE